MYVHFLIVVIFFARSLIFSFVFSLILFIRLNNLKCVYEIMCIEFVVSHVCVIVEERRHYTFLSKFEFTHHDG